jgi:hypothetical protein
LISKMHSTLWAARTARRLEGGERAVGEAGKEQRGIIDTDWVRLAGKIVLAFLDEGLHDRGYLVKVAVQPHGGIDAMREPVAGHAAAGYPYFRPPLAGAGLGPILGNAPVLQELGAIVKYFVEPSVFDDLFGECDCRYAAIIVPDHVPHLGFQRLHHLHGFAGVAAERLLAEDHLAGLRRGEVLFVEGGEMRGALEVLAVGID